MATPVTMMAAEQEPHQVEEQCGRGATRRAATAADDLGQPGGDDDNECGAEDGKAGNERRRTSHRPPERGGGGECMGCAGHRGNCNCVSGKR